MWATKVEDIQRMERAERMMIRWMCKVTLKDRIQMDVFISLIMF